MDREEYVLRLHHAWLMASIVREMPLAAMIDVMERADAVGPMLHPTLYREKRDALAQDLRLVRALRTVQTELEAIAAVCSPAARMEALESAPLPATGAS
jgi:hypothetical protein